MIYDVLMLLFGVVLTLGTAVFVAAEFSYVALDVASVERRANEGDKKAKQVVKALRILSTQLSGAQVGITLTTILLGYTTQVSLMNLFTKMFTSFGLALTLSTTIAVALSVIFINAFSMLFGELVPKNMALADPFHSASLVTPVQAAFTKLLHPLIKVLNDTANGVLHAMGITPMEEISSARSASELAALVRHSAQEGTLDTSTATLLTKSIGIGELTAIDVMTDRGRMVYLGESASAADVVELARTTGHSRFPIVGDDSDDIVAFVSLRRAIAVPWDKRSEVSVLSSSLTSEVLRVPETLALAPLLLMLRAEGLQIAVVVDEYGGTSGIVTLEDVVEEIVGEVADEHDRRRHGIRRQNDGSWKVPGTLRPDELLERTGIFVPEDGPYETLGGFMMLKLGRIGEPHDKVQVENTTLEILRMDGRRIDQILVRAAEPEPTDEGREDTK
ncbi:hemolysin family protein [Actinomyces sp.]|uniref:hemolysin family protein n=1 Tax=Actinomyces sp. TaxID=29317 RepID=UPI00291099AE|nr:hemolysin family protein [Actinomyces sp.]MDU5230711.1 hemolysin family protein [Actinomyces sp.]MDU6756144.1 hemolysin family protein [Actinomyces sp.]